MVVGCMDDKGRSFMIKCDSVDFSQDVIAIKDKKEVAYMPYELVGIINSDCPIRVHIDSGSIMCDYISVTGKRLQAKIGSRFFDVKNALHIKEVYV